MNNSLSALRAFALVWLTLLMVGCGSSGTVVSGGNAYLDIVNKTDAAIWYLYLSPCSASSWGDDQLGSDVIGRGSSYRFTMTPGCWDLRAETGDGRQTERFGVQMGYGEEKTWTLTGSGK